MITHSRRYLLMLSAAVVIPTAASAQQAPIAVPTEQLPDPQASTAEKEQARAEADAGVGEIVVTAQRREQSLQRVPISVVAASAAQLQSAGVATGQDLATITPGLVMGQQQNSITPYMRGIGTQTGFSGTEGSVAIYVDGVYYPSARGTIFALNNIERIEVLKGPQGTLFGRNATGGLIQVVTREPSREFSLQGTIGYANYDTPSANLYVTGALSESITADLALYGSYQNDGWGKNLVLGNDVNLRREGDARAKFKFEVGPNDTAVLSFDYSKWQSDNGNIRQPIVGSVGVNGAQRVGTEYDFNSQVPFADLDSHHYGASLSWKHDFAGGTRFSSLTSKRWLTVRSGSDTDGTPAVLSDVHYTSRGDYLQQEFMLSGSTSRLDWTTSLFYFNSKDGNDPLRLRANPPSAANARRYSVLKTESYAASAQATYAIFSATNVTAGIRYTRDKKSGVGFTIAEVGSTFPVGTIFNNTDALPRSQTHKTFENVSWRLAIDQQIGSNVLLYASANKGFKSGGYNSSTVTDPPVNPESLLAFEVGFKSELFDRSLRFNGAGFYYDYKNIQLLSVGTVGSTVYNAAAGRSKGVDLDLVWVPRIGTGRLQFTGSLSYIDAEYTEFPDAIISTPRPTTVGGNVQGRGPATGRDMIRAPGLSYSLGGEYTFPVANDYEVQASSNLQHTGKFYWEPDNRLTQPAYDLVNAQLAFGPTDKRWRLRVWGKNIFDERYLVSLAANAFGDLAVYAAPRTYGVALDFKF